MSSFVRKPRPSRYRKRLAIRFGASEPLLSGGFTTNISPRGLGIQGAASMPPGQRLMIAVRLPDGVISRVEGVVSWSRRGSTTMGIPSALGVRLDRLDAAFERFLGELREREITADNEPLPRPSIRPVASPQAIAPRPFIYRPERIRAALSVRFGRERPLKLSGVTLTVSPSGLSVASPFLQPVSTPLAFEIQLPTSQVAQADGSVVWAKSISAADHTPNSMGVRLHRVDEAWFQYLYQLHA